MSQQKRTEIKQYWENGPPMAFTDKPLTYEQKRKFRYDLQDYMRKAFRFEEFKDKKLLDVGCGAGIDSAEFARYGAKVTSVDLSKKAVILTKHLFKEANLIGEILQADCCKLPFKDNFFDCVYAFGVLHHVPNAEESLKEIHRVLKKHGTFLGMVYNENSLLYAYSVLYLHGDTERRQSCPYVKVYTKETVRRLFGKFFSNLSVSVHYNVIDLPTRRKVKFQLNESDAELGWHIIIRGTKV